MKISKKLRVMAASMMIMLFGAAACVTGTVAWFVASNVVEVTGPTVQAEAEEGIVIANETHAADADWGQKVTVSYSPSASYIPTSTVKGVTWYHAYAENVDSQEAGTGTNAVTAISDISVSSGLASSATLSNKNVYLLNKLFIQGSGKANDLTSQDLFVKEITATAATSNSTDLNKSIRVLFVLDADKDGIVDDTETGIVYAPLADANVTYKVNGVANACTAYKVASSSASDKLLDNGTIAKYTTAGTDALQILVFVYFEGEDVNCKTANIAATLDNISITFKFENKAHA